MSGEEMIPRIKVSVGDPNFERMIEIQTAMLSAAALDQLRDGMDPALHTALTMASAGFLAGYLGGASIIAGVATDGDKRRMGEMLLTNFRQGIQIGKQNAMSAATDGATKQ